jgi:hypothetical protein
MYDGEGLEWGNSYLAKAVSLEGWSSSAVFNLTALALDEIVSLVVLQFLYENLFLQRFCLLKALLAKHPLSAMPGREQGRQRYLETYSNTGWDWGDQPSATTGLTSGNSTFSFSVPPLNNR